MILPNYSCISSRRVSRVLLLTAALTAPGCQLAFGTYSGNVSQDAGGTAGVGGNPATGGNATDSGAPSGGDTTGAGGAAGSGGCAPGNCSTCSTGDSSFCGNTTDAGTPLFTCEDSRFIQSDTCRSPLYCERGANYCVACAANAALCEWKNGVLTGFGMRCNSDQTDWTSLFPCQNGGCFPDAGTPDRCDLCNEGDTACSNDNSKLLTCKNANWQTRTCGNLGCQTAVLGVNPARCFN